MIETHPGDKGCIAIMNATNTKQQQQSQQQPTSTSNAMLEDMSQQNHNDTKSNGTSSTQIAQPISSNHQNETQSIQNTIKTQQNDSMNNPSIDSVKNTNLNLNNTNTSQNPSTKVTNITDDDNNNSDQTPMEIESENKQVKKDDDSDDDDLFADIQVATTDLYEISNYTFGKKNEESKCKMLQGMTLEKLSQALQKSYTQRGMRRSVGAVLITHSHNFPHVLLLQRHDGKGEFALPGGRLRPGESDEEGLLRKLRNKLYPIDEETLVNTDDDDDEEQQLDVGEKIGNWYAIDFSRRYYPYVPAHVTKPKEELHVYVVSLPKSFMFAVPKNLQLIAVPLFELYNNSATYGDVICAIPALLSRYHINYC